MAAILLFLLFLALGADVNSYSLKQVLILGRHNIRAPLTANLEIMTPKEWPKWETEIAHLTPKGALLESFMGDYFAEWFKKEGFFTDSCPGEDQVIIYANAPQRTRETAREFTEAAFKNCNITILYKTGVRMDPIFHPIIHNASKELKLSNVNDMQKKLDTFDLTEAYLELNKILDFNNSVMCKMESLCDFSKGKNELIYELGEEPNVTGPLGFGNSIVDIFLMQYFSGMPMESIAWGGVREENLKLLTDITKANQDVRFNYTGIAGDVAKPLLKYMSDIFVNEEPKFTLLVGHDSNLNSVMSLLDFEWYELPNSLEKTPIGGKLVFQKWYDEELNRDLLKVNYVYQTLDQIRNRKKLSLDSPPHWEVMELKGCRADANGHCLWKDFINVLKRI